LDVPSYRELKVWQHAKRLAVECGMAVKRFPAEEQHALADQLRRAAYGVPLNISEGASRKGSKEFRRFLDSARGSLSEVQTALEIAKDLQYLSEEEYQRIDAIATETAKTLWGLLRKVSESSIRAASR
jgi:four helix bundle protein